MPLCVEKSASVIWDLVPMEVILANLSNEYPEGPQLALVNEPMVRKHPQHNDAPIKATTALGIVSVSIQPPGIDISNHVCSAHGPQKWHFKVLDCRSILGTKDVLNSRHAMRRGIRLFHGVKDH